MLFKKSSYIKNATVAKLCIFMYDEVIMTHGREFHFAVGDCLRAINLAYNRLRSTPHFFVDLGGFLVQMVISLRVLYII